MDVDARVARALRPLPVIWRVRTALGILLVSTNAIGAVVVFCLIALVVPLPHVEDETRLQIENLVLTAIYAAAAIAVGMVRGLTLNRDIVGWLRQGREASAADQEAVLGAPVRLFWMQVQLWAMGALLFGIFNLRVDVGLGFLVAGIVSLAGLTVCAVTYLFAERAMRPLARSVPNEAAHWEPLEPIVVRGRSEPTAVMTPRDAP
jgi:adenylate cyclase